MLSGYAPFHETKHKNVFDCIKTADYDFPAKTWGKISPSAKHLIKRLLTLDPAQRITAEEALNSPWMQGRSDIDEETKKTPKLKPKSQNNSSSEDTVSEETLSEEAHKQKKETDMKKHKRSSSQSKKRNHSKNQTEETEDKKDVVKKKRSSETKKRTHSSKQTNSTKKKKKSK